MASGVSSIFRVILLRFQLVLWQMPWTGRRVVVAVYLPPIASRPIEAILGGTSRAAERTIARQLTLASLRACLGS